MVGAFAAALLAPLPALGTVFQGSWLFVSRQASAPVLDLDRGFHGPGVGAPMASSSILATTRQLQVAKGRDVLDVSDACRTLLEGTSLSTIVYVKDVRGLTRVMNPSADAVGDNRVVRTPTHALPPDTSRATGNYTIVVRLRYNKSAPGLWDNETPLPGSPYHFLFTGL
jgi:hypothetical protein